MSGTGNSVTCYNENLIESCDDLGTDNAPEISGYRLSEGVPTPIPRGAEVFTCDQFWTRMNDLADGGVMNGETYLASKIPVIGATTDKGMKCMPRGGGGGTGCMSPASYFDAIPVNDQSGGEGYPSTWDSLYSTLSSQFIDSGSICQRTESINSVDPAVVDATVVDPAVVGPTVVDPAVVDPAVVGPTVVDPVDPAVVDPAVVDPAVVDPAVVETQYPSCDISHFLQYEQPTLSNNCQDSTGSINAGESCYIYCNSITKAGPDPTDIELIDAVNNKKAAKVLCPPPTEAGYIESCNDTDPDSDTQCPYTNWPGGDGLQCDVSRAPILQAHHYVSISLLGSALVLFL